VRYAQGWLVGVSASTSGLVPFEVATTAGAFAVTHSGPVSADVAASFHLALSAAVLALQRNSHGVAEHRIHLNLPLRHVRTQGPSCRLAFANTVIASLTTDAGFIPDQTVLLGDLTLAGQVLPVGQTTRKAATAHAAGLNTVVVAPRQALPGTVAIGSLDDIPGVRA